MTPAEPQSPERARHDSSGQPQRRTTQAQWTLTQEAFEKLLARFSSDRNEAAKQYVALEMKMVRYFEKQKIATAEIHGVDVLNRVARKIAEGKEIENVTAYAYRVAYLVYLEVLNQPDFVEIDPEQAPQTTPEPLFEDSDRQRRQTCFDSCLKQLTSDNRELILGYYQEDGRAKIEFRKWLAASLKVSLDALRIRAHRIRKSLEECIAECLGQPV